MKNQKIFGNFRSPVNSFKNLKTRNFETIAGIKSNLDKIDQNHIHSTPVLR